MVLFAVGFYLYTDMMLWVVIVIISYFITQLKFWDFIFIPKEHAVFEKFEGEKNAVCQPSSCCFRGWTSEVSLGHTKTALDVSVSPGLLALLAPLPAKRADQSGLLHRSG